MFDFIALEKEIQAGIFKINDADNNAIVFLREIENLENDKYISKKFLSQFVELDENNEIDLCLKQRLNKLKTEIVTNALPESNIHKYKVCENKVFLKSIFFFFILLSQIKLDPDYGISRITHNEYLTQFGSTFYESVKKLIDRNASKEHYLDKIEPKDKHLMQEILDHANFCNNCVEKFHGRNDLINKVKSFEVIYI